MPDASDHSPTLKRPKTEIPVSRRLEVESETKAEVDETLKSMENLDETMRNGDKEKAIPEYKKPPSLTSMGMKDLPPLAGMGMRDLPPLAGMGMKDLPPVKKGTSVVRGWNLGSDYNADSDEVFGAAEKEDDMLIKSPNSADELIGKPSTADNLEEEEDEIPEDFEDFSVGEMSDLDFPEGPAKSISPVKSISPASEATSKIFHVSALEPDCSVDSQELEDSCDHYEAVKLM